MKRIIILLGLSLTALATACREPTTEAAAPTTQAPTTTPAPTTTAAPTTTQPICEDGATQRRGERLCVNGEWIDNPTPPTSTTEAPITPFPSDFDIDLIVMEDECFDTAGALVTVEIDLGWRVPIDGRVTLVYTIYGGEYGSDTFNLDIEGDTYSYDSKVISTASCYYDLQVEVVRVIQR